MLQFVESFQLILTAFDSFFSVYEGGKGIQIFLWDKNSLTTPFTTDNFTQQFRGKEGRCALLKHC